VSIENAERIEEPGELPGGLGFTPDPIEVLAMLIMVAYSSHPSDQRIFFDFFFRVSF
jgi:hypothetical protein